MKILKQAKASYKGLFDFKQTNYITAYSKSAYAYDENKKENVLMRVNYYLSISDYATFRYDTKEEVLKAFDRKLKNNKNIFKNYKYKIIKNA